MKKRITVKLFSLVLVLAMVFAQIPAGMTAYAAEDPSQGATEYSDALFSGSNPNALGGEDGGTTFDTQNNDGTGGGGDIGNPGTGEEGDDAAGGNNGGTGTGSGGTENGGTENGGSENDGTETGGTETGGNGSGDAETPTDVPTNSDVPGGDTEDENNGEPQEEFIPDANDMKDEEVFVEEEEEETVTEQALNASIVEGEVKASTIATGARLAMNGDTTLVMDQPLSIESIRPKVNKSLALRIVGDNRLTVENELDDDAVIKAHLIDISAPLTVEHNSPSSGYSEGAIRATGSVIISADALIASNNTGIRAGKDIIMDKGKASVGCADFCLESLNGDIKINNELSAYCFEGSSILARNGNIIIGSNALVSAETSGKCGVDIGIWGWAIFAAEGEIEINNGAVVNAKGKNGRAIGAKKNIRMSGCYVTAESKREAICSDLKDITIDNCRIEAQGSIGIDGYGYISILNNSIVNSVGRANGIRHYSGDLSGGVLIENSYVHASGDEEAIEVWGTLTIQEPLRITSPVGAKIKGNAIRDSSGEFAKDVTIGEMLLDASVKLKENGANYPGSTLELVISNAPSDRVIQWQFSSDNSTFKDFAGANGLTFALKPIHAGYYIRAKITSPRYFGEACSESRLIKDRSLTGTVSLSGATAVVGTQIKATVQNGTVTEANAAGKLRYQWQVWEWSSYGDITGATGSSYTPIPGYAGINIRVKVTADGYSGTIYSAPRRVNKKPNPTAPVTPVLSVASPYTTVTVTNAKASQEYYLTYHQNGAPVTPDWSKAIPGKTGSLKLPAEAYRSVIVFTRIKETNTSQAGTTHASATKYNGSTAEIKGFNFDKHDVSTKVGAARVPLTVQPLPENWAGWNNDYQVKWYVYGDTSAVALFTSPNGPATVSPGALTGHKTVYVEALNQTKSVTIGVEKQVGYTDVYKDTCNFHIANEAGEYVLEQMLFEPVSMYQGETQTVDFTTRPSPATISSQVTFVKSSGPSGTGPVLTKESGNRVKIAVPEDAKAGTYYYEAKINGAGTPTMSSVKITVLPTRATVTLNPDNGYSGQTITKPSVAIGASFVLPLLPDSFTVPTDMEFGGWKKGTEETVYEPGEVFEITEDTEFRVHWILHECRKYWKHVEEEEATCLWDGNREYWHCSYCNGKYKKLTENSWSTISDTEIPIPALGHDWGSDTIEWVVPLTENSSGIYNRVRYCNRCHDVETLSNVTVKPYVLERVELKADSIGMTSFGLHMYGIGNANDKLVWRNNEDPNPYPGNPDNRYGYHFHNCYNDAACKDPASGIPEVGESFFVVVQFLNRNANDPGIFYTALTPGTCTLDIPGYATECIRVTPYEEGGIDCADLVFKLTAVGDYAVVAVPEKVELKAAANASGSYDVAPKMKVTLKNVGTKMVKVTIKDDIILEGEHKDMFTVSKESGVIYHVHPDIPQEICEVAVKNNLKPETNRIYEASLIVKSDHAADGAQVTIPLTFTLNKNNAEGEPVPEGIWMKLPDGDVYEYAGRRITPVVKVYWGEKELTTADYTVSYKNNVNAYTLKDGETGFSAAKAPTITIKGKGNYKGSFTRTFVITPIDLKAKATAPDVELQYTGKLLKPTTAVTAEIDGKTVKLVAGRDFTYNYNVNADSIMAPKIVPYDVMIAAKSANFTGTKVFKATVVDKTPISKVTVSGIKNVAFNGSFHTPALTLKHGKNQLVKNTDYLVSYDDNRSVGTATVTITGIGKYFGTVKKTFKITGTSIAKAQLVKKTNWFDAFEYNGTAWEQASSSYTLTLDKGKTTINSICYDVEYQNNTNPGTAKIIFTGRPEWGYTGKLVKTFKIAGYDMSGSKISVHYMDGSEKPWSPNPSSAPTFPYNLGGVKPEPVVKFDGKVLEKGKDYTVSWSNNAAVKTDLNDGKKIPTVTIRGKGAYKGAVTRSFKIETKAFNSSTVTVIASDVNWQNKHGIYKPAITVLENSTGRVLQAGRDYGAWNDKDFPIRFVYAKLPSSGEKVKRFNGKNQPLTEVAVTPNTTTVEPDHIIPAGTEIRAVVTGKGAYSNTTASSAYQIVEKKVNITGSAFKITIPDQQWTGKPVELTANDITVTYKVSKTETKTLKYGSDYVIMSGSYLNNVNRGTAKVTIRGMNGGITGDFGGTKQVTFKIVQRRMNYEITYDKNEAELVKRLFNKLSPADQSQAVTVYGPVKTAEKWFAANYRITGTMKTSSTSYGVALPANTYRLQRYHAATKRWVNVPVTEVEFKGWATKSDRTKEDFANKAPFKPSWLFRLTYDDSVKLYAVWEVK